MNGTKFHDARFLTREESKCDDGDRKRTIHFAGHNAGAHARLDALYSAFDLTQGAGYGSFLLAHAPAFMAVERALTDAGAARIVPGWPNRLRSGALAEDIAAMCLRPPPPVASPAFAGDARILGGVYVLEGSRLGGQVLIRRVPPGLPTSFLTPGNPADWRAFISLIEHRLNSDALRVEAIAAAKAVFAVFETSARGQLESSVLET